MTARPLLLAALLACCATNAGAWHLSWSPILYQPACGSCCEPSQPLTSPVDHYAVQFLQQSPFYASHRDSMQDNRSAFFTAHWAQVRAEADWQFYLAVAAPPAVIADTSGSKTWCVRGVKRSGAMGCPGNMVRRP